MKGFRVYRRGDKWAVDLRSLGFGKKILDIPTQANEVEAIHAGYAVLARLQQQQQEEAAAQKLKEMTPETPTWDMVMNAFTGTLCRFGFETSHVFEEVAIPPERWPERARAEEIEWWPRSKREELLARAMSCGPTLLFLKQMSVGQLHTLDLLRAADGDQDLSVVTWLWAGLHMLSRRAPHVWRRGHFLADALRRCVRERPQPNFGMCWRPNQESYPYPVLAKQLGYVAVEPQTCEALVRVLAIEVAVLRLQWSLVAMRPAVPSGQDDPRRRLTVVL